MKLIALLDYLNITVSNKQDDIVIQEIKIDSRKVEAGDLFIAIPGLITDGRQYIAQAIANGAVAVLAEAPYHSDFADNIPIISVMNLAKKLGNIASCFYNNPSNNMNIVGVTGTNGKSSVCQYIAAILRNLSSSCSTIGTLGISSVDDQYTITNHTTPEPIALQKTLASLYAQNINNIAMEVSSHALEQDRVVGVNFSTAVFTNLTPEHLDYHHTMTNYWQAKLKLFLNFFVKNVVVNLDDPYGRQLLNLLPDNINVIGYTLNHQRKGTCSILVASNIKYAIDGMSTKLISDYGTHELAIPGLGDFNLSNMLAAIAVGVTLGYSFEEILSVIPKVRGIPGRMQCIKQESRPLVVIDYAHTPDAMTKALMTLKQYCYGKLWCIFGCGGDRDKTKRTAMLDAALAYSDYIILTQDNPRTEDPQQIIADMLKSHTGLNSVMVEIDRFTAIEMAINAAATQDIILIAGKGHEEYQIIGCNKIPFSDIKVVENLLKKLPVN